MHHLIMNTDRPFVLFIGCTEVPPKYHVIYICWLTYRLIRFLQKNKLLKLPSYTLDVTDMINQTLEC